MTEKYNNTKTDVCASPSSPFKVDAFEFPANNTSLGKYSKLIAIGEGGVAKIFKAYDSELERYVALKVLKRGISAPEHIKKRFLTEIQAQARLNIPGTIRLFDCGEDQGWLYYAMELIEGTTLKECITQKKLSLNEQIDIIIKLCKIISQIHKNHLCHRDIKPSNVMIDAHNEIRLLDFGLVKILNQNDKNNTRAGEIAGSPAYMSPEMTYGLENNSKTNISSTDVYSLGMLTYEFLTFGKFPYDVVTIPQEEIFNCIRTKPPTPIRKHLPNISEKLNKTIMKTLDKDAEQRISIDELIKQLTLFSGQNKPPLNIKKIFISILFGVVMLLAIQQYFKYKMNNIEIESKKTSKVNKIKPAKPYQQKNTTPCIYRNYAPEKMLSHWNELKTEYENSNSSILLFSIPKNTILTITDCHINKKWTYNSSTLPMGIIKTSAGTRIEIQLDLKDMETTIFFIWVTKPGNVDTLY